MENFINIFLCILLLIITLVVVTLFVSLIILLIFDVIKKITDKKHDIITNLIAIKLREKEEEILNGKDNANVRT